MEVAPVRRRANVSGRRGVSEGLVLFVGKGLVVRDHSAISVLTIVLIKLLEGSHITLP